MAFLNSIESVVTIILMIALGFILRQRGWFADSFAGNISRLITNIALPASIFVSVLKFLTRDKLVSLSGGLVYAFLSFAISYLVAYILAYVFKVRPGRKGTFINVVVNANTIFIGLPLNVALFGNQALSYFLVYYVMNTISTWAIGALIIANDSPDKGQKAFNWKKLLPAPLIGFLVALVFLLLAIPVPDFATSTLTYVGNLVTPLSLIYIGIVLADAGLKSIHFDKDTVVALVGRFIFAPAVMLTLLVFAGGFLGHLPHLEAQTLAVQAATPALAVLPILANEANGDVKYATNVVTTSTILFVVVVPVVNTIATMLFK